MNILDFDYQKHEEALDIAGQNSADLDEDLSKSYHSLLLLGNNINSNDPDLLEVAIFNIRLCYVYYKMKEDYLKLAELKKLVDSIEQGKQLIVDKSMIDEIVINLN